MSLHRRSRVHVGHVRWHPHWPTRQTERLDLGPGFRKLWLAGIASNAADGITFAALPLLAATLTRDPFLIALAAVIHSLPWFGFELLAGEIVDRVDRKRLMLWGNLARACAVGLIASLAATDLLELPLLYLAAFALGVAETLVDTSWEALVPRLVPAKALEVANGRTQAAEWTANDLAGPPLGGLLFAAAVAAPFYVEAAAFILAAGLIASIPGVHRAERHIAHGRGAVRRDIWAGISWLWEQRVLRGLSAMAGASNLVGTATFSVFVLFAQDILELSNIAFGMILSATGVGGIVGAAVAHRVEKRIGPGSLLLGSMAGLGLAALAVAVTSSPVVVGIALAVDGLLIGMWNVVVVSLRQALTPDDMRGRVASVARTVAFGAIPLGAAIGGVMAEAAGLRSPFFLAAAVYGVAVPLMSRIVTNQKVSEMRAAAAGRG